MKIRVSYELTPPLPIAEEFHIVTPDAEITLIEQGGTYNRIQVTISDKSGQLMPRVVATKSDGIPMNISVSPEVHKRTLHFARTYVATLGVLGFPSRVDPSPTQFEWLREHDAEQLPQINNLAIQRNPHSELRSVRLDQLVHAAMSMNRMAQWVEVLELHNAGLDNFSAKRFADSLRYHFFVIESLYGNGKSNPNKLVAELLEHRRVVISVRSAIRCPMLFVTTSEQKKQYREQFPREDPAEVLLHLAKIRGQISHHNQRSANKWTVAHQHQFLVDAIATANISHRLVWRILRSEMWSEDVISACGGLRD